jgi:hypothetical protein
MALAAQVAVENDPQKFHALLLELEGNGKTLPPRPSNPHNK